MMVFDLNNKNLFGPGPSTATEEIRSDFQLVVDRYNKLTNQIAGTLGYTITAEDIQYQSDNNGNANENQENSNNNTHVVLENIERAVSIGANPDSVNKRAAETTERAFSHLIKIENQLDSAESMDRLGTARGPLVDVTRRDLEQADEYISQLEQIFSN
jgi:hypothetical protein